LNSYCSFSIHLFSIVVFNCSFFAWSCHTHARTVFDLKRIIIRSFNISPHHQCPEDRRHGRAPMDRDAGWGCPPGLTHHGDAPRGSPAAKMSYGAHHFVATHKHARSFGAACHARWRHVQVGRSGRSWHRQCGVVYVQDGAALGAATRWRTRTEIDHCRAPRPCRA